MSRNEFDHYRDTPERWATLQLLNRLPALRDGWVSRSEFAPRDKTGPLAVILEPCNGTGNISKALRDHFGDGDGSPVIHRNDIDQRHPANDTYLDAANADLYEPRPDWIVTNTPFNIAPILIPIFVREARLGVACILRLTYLEPTQNRAGWLAENPPTAVWTMPRMSFTGDGKTDSVTAAWFVWTPTPLDAEPLQPIIPVTAGARLF